MAREGILRPSQFVLGLTMALLSASAQAGEDEYHFLEAADENRASLPPLGVIGPVAIREAFE